MSAQIIDLPTAQTSFVTVTKNGPFHVVELVTPSPLPCGSERTAMYSMTNKDMVYWMAQRTAAKLQRPFKHGGRSA